MTNAKLDDKISAGANLAQSASDGLKRAGRQASEQLDRVETQASDMIDSVKAVVDLAADEVSTNLAKLRHQLSDAYGPTLKQARKRAKSVGSAVRDEPYLGLALAAAAILVGCLLLTTKRQ